MRQPGRFCRYACLPFGHRSRTWSAMIYALLTTIALMITIAGLVALFRALLAFFRLFADNVSELRGTGAPSSPSAPSKLVRESDRLLALKSMAFFAVAVGVAAALLLLRNQLFALR